MQLILLHLSGLPQGPLNSRLSEIERHLDTTYFCWIGGSDDDSPFYYRIQSPVVLIEFDCHPGVAFDNDEPSRHHIHTILRKCLQAAVDSEGLLPQNPADRVRPPKPAAEAPRHDRLRYWTAPQLGQFLGRSGHQRHHSAWLVLATTGMRRRWRRS